MKQKLGLWGLFKEMFLMSSMSFGGGYVIINMVRDRFVKKDLFTESDLMDMAAIAQASPGAIAVSISTLVGSKIRGWQGALVSFVATILPPIIIITGVSFIYEDLIKNPIALSLFKGMEAGVAASILILVIDMYKDLRVSVGASMTLLVWLSLFLSLVLKMHPVAIIFLNLLICILLSLKKGGKKV